MSGLSGFLSPQGEWIPCEYCEHSVKAYEIADKYKLSPFDNDWNTLPIEERVMNANFIRFVFNKNNPYAESYIFFNTHDFTSKITKEQQKFILDNIDNMTHQQVKMYKEHCNEDKVVYSSIHK